MELFDDLTVRENILLATQEVRWWHWALAPFTSTSGAMPATAVELIRELDLERWLDHLPDTVPFGVRRLVGVVRAAAGKPSVLLLDEPAAGLDDVEIEELAKAVRWLATQWGLSILLVEHHVGLVTSVSDEVVAIDFGRVIFRGSPIAVVDNAQVREAYLGHGAEAFI